jgi:hypothetical protein
MVMRISRQPSIDQNKQQNVDSFSYLGSLIRNDARCTREIKTRIAMKKAAFDKNKVLFTSKLDSDLRKKPIKCYIWSVALCGAGTWTMRKVDQKYLESFEMDGEDCYIYSVLCILLHCVVLCVVCV